MNIKKDLMPREKALEYGINSLNNNELLALIIKSAYRNKTVFDIVEELFNVSGGFENLLSLSYEELISIKGIKKAKALEILAILEISRRLTKIDNIAEESMSSPNKVVDWLRFNLGFSITEEFFVIYLNARGKVLKSEVLFKGSKNKSIVGIDEVLRKAILLKSSGIIVAHNHPSGNCTPSKEDIMLTTQMKKACELVGIPLFDHIIVSKTDHYSFKSNGLC